MQIYKPNTKCRLHYLNFLCVLLMLYNINNGPHNTRIENFKFQVDMWNRCVAKSHLEKRCNTVIGCGWSCVRITKFYIMLYIEVCRGML